MQINKGVQAMMKRRKSNDPNFRISSERILKLGHRELILHFNFWIKIKVNKSGENQ